MFAAVSSPAPAPSEGCWRSCRELALLFGKLGAFGFGGPIAFLAMMEDEVVRRRAWLSRQRFLDLLGVTYLIPGPNATEMAAQIGLERAGLSGGVAAATAFTLPSVLIASTLAWFYARYGNVPAAGPFLAGIKPVVVAVVALATVRFAQTALGSMARAVIAASVLAAALAGLDEVIALAAGGILGAILLHVAQRRNSSTPVGAAAWLATVSCAVRLEAAVGPVAVLATSALGPVSLSAMTLFFLKVGATLYGSGFVLIAYLQSGLVTEGGWLTQQQLLDAIAVGQITPGPLLSTVTFIGYLLGGPWGAVAATVAVFSPGLIATAVVHPLVPWLRGRRWAGYFLDAINAASVGLMAAVVLQLGRAALVDFRSSAFALVAAVLLFYRIAGVWVVLAGAAAGWLLG